VEILKALYRGADVLILDEPTGVLTPSEADQLFEILRVLKSQGKTILLITHKLREIMAITDRVSVMRRGEMVATLDTRKTNPAELAELMVGRRVLLRVDKGPARPGRSVLAVEGLTVRDEKGVARVEDVSFEIRAGEIVGIAGVAGNGQSELLQAIAGILPVASGRILIDGRDVAAADPAEMRGCGLAHVPEDRLRMGLVKAFAAYESAILGYHRDKALGPGPLLDQGRLVSDLAAKMQKYDVRPQNPRLKTANFSGGNAQKIVLAREIERDPELLIVGQPTRGVDIGAIEFIHRQLIAMRDAGKAILVVSVELEEIIGLSDRILVMCGGRITGERRPDEAGEQEIGLLMAGVTEQAA
jgi:simple sugar transport system ATP-binding protein